MAILEGLNMMAINCVHMTGVGQMPMSTMSSPFIKADGGLLELGVLRPDITGVTEDPSHVGSTESRTVLTGYCQQVVACFKQPFQNVEDVMDPC